MSEDEGLKWSSEMGDEMLGRVRAFMWNEDQLALMAARAGVTPGARLLDVGCGRGFLGLALLKDALPGGELVGVDRDADLTARAAADAAALGLAASARFEAADAAALPVEGASFDVVMCQTLLMHLSEPREALAEMVRATKSGGRVVAIEPDYLMTMLNWAGRLGDLEVPDLGWERRVLDFFGRALEGRRRRGLGDFRIGRKLAFLMHQLGLRDVRVYLKDRVNVLLPPYRDGDQQGLFQWLCTPGKRQSADWKDLSFKEDFLAAGGDEATWAAFTKDKRAGEMLQGLSAHAGGLWRVHGDQMYVAVGTRP